MLADIWLRMPVDFVSHVDAEKWFEGRQYRLSLHGNPPRDFIREWLISQGENYSWLSYKHPEVRLVSALHGAAKQLWRDLLTPTPTPPEVSS